LKARVRRAIEAPHERIAPRRRRLTGEERAENRRFNDRLRFDQPSKTWVRPDIHDIPSTWPAFAEAVRVWGPPGFWLPFGGTPNRSVK
jgi:hypothetical protein